MWLASLGGKVVITDLTFTSLSSLHIKRFVMVLRWWKGCACLSNVRKAEPFGDPNHELRYLGDQLHSRCNVLVPDANVPSSSKSADEAVRRPGAEPSAKSIPSTTPPVSSNFSCYKKILCGIFRCCCRPASENFVFKASLDKSIPEVTPLELSTAEQHCRLRSHGSDGAW